MNLNVAQKQDAHSGGGLPPPPEDPDGPWDDGPDPGRRAFAFVMEHIKKFFEPHPWFAGLGIGSFKVESPAQAIADSLPIDESFRSNPKGFNRATGIVVQVLDRTPEQIEEIKKSTSQLLTELHASMIHFAVINRSPIDEAIAYELALTKRDSDLQALQSHPEISRMTSLIKPARHPTGPFWIKVPDSLSLEGQQYLSTLISQLTTRRFEIFNETTWDSITKKR